MKTSIKIIAALAAAASLTVAGIAAAQPGGGPGWGHMGGGWGPMGGGWGHMGGWGPGGGGWGPMGGGWGHMGGWGPGGGFDMTAAAAGQLAALKTQLKITPAQESVWKAYEGAVTQQAGAMQAMRDQFHAQWQNAKPGEAPPDMAAQHQAMWQLRQSSWQAQDKAFKDLYAALTPEQQALASGGRGGPRGPRR